MIMPPVSLEEKYAASLDEIKRLTALVQNITISKFGIERFKNSDKSICYYTGFKSYNLFLDFFNWLSSAASSMPLWSAVRGQVEAGTVDCAYRIGGRRKLPLADELFLFLFRLRQGHDEKSLSDQFEISESTVSRLTITWANFLYFSMSSIPIWPSRSQVSRFMPNCFKKKYSSTRIIIDCCEIFCQNPSSLFLQSEFFSFYKNHTTLKCLIGIAPHGPITLVSSLFCGSISDSEITRKSGLLNLLEPSDSVMADKGFAIRDMLAFRGVTLNVPPFNFNGRFTATEVLETAEISSLRVHVECAIRRIREYQMFDRVIPLNMIGTVNQLWTVACMLSNFSSMHRSPVGYV